MKLALGPLDLVVLGVYLCLPVAIGLAFRRRGSKDTGSFFLSGRALPWWLAGTSMAADTFASDTPLYVAGLVRRTGVWGNWQWWSFAFSGLLGVFVLAKLWRRSEVLTDIEFVELRYEGRSAAVLRGLKAFILAVPFNAILLGGMPLLAMAKLLMVLGGVDGTGSAGELTPEAAATATAIAKGIAIVICLGIVLAYSTVSGLWAIVVNDFVLFWLALGGAITLAWVAVGEVGGIEAMKTGLAAVEPSGGGSRLDFLPPAGTAFQAFLVFVGVQWWAHRTVDGGGVNIQRMLACRSEGHAAGAMLWFNLMNFAGRTWPWVLTGLAAILIYPTLGDPEMAYPMAIRDLLPGGVRGFVVASLFAAFMTTADTQLNWGASYVVNDLYKRFVRPEADEARLLRVSRISILGLAALSAAVAFLGDSVAGTFTFLISFFAGTGTVFLGRWFWWRVNGPGELSAMIAAPVASIVWAVGAGEDGFLSALPGHWQIPVIATVTTTTWVLVTLSTRPVPMEHLVAFYRRTRPPGFWGPVRRAAPDLPDPEPILRDIGLWGAGLALVLGAMVAIGKAFLGTPVEAAVAAAVALGGGVVVVAAYRRRAAAAPAG